MEIDTSTPREALLATWWSANAEIWRLLGCHVRFGLAQVGIDLMPPVIQYRNQMNCIGARFQANDSGFSASLAYRAPRIRTALQNRVHCLPDSAAAASQTQTTSSSSGRTRCDHLTCSGGRKLRSSSPDTQRRLLSCLSLRTETKKCRSSLT
jgi:hypothetical protein